MGILHNRLHNGRARYLIPNAITAANILCGFYSIVASFQNNMYAAAWAILIAGIFDLFDGRVARLVRATSEFGENFDTLSDLLSFGIAPALLLYQAGLVTMGRFSWLLSFVYVVCVAFRLARFSVQVGEGHNRFFQGLSSPVSAATVAAFILFSTTLHLNWNTHLAGSLFFCLGLALLMVSKLRFPTFKEMNWRSRQGIAVIIAGSCGVSLSLLRPGVFIFLSAFAFITYVLIWNMLLWRAEVLLPRRRARI